MSNTPKRGQPVLKDRKITKSTAFTKEERDLLGLRGLLPYAVGTQARQINRVVANIRKKESPIEKYIFLSALQDRNERLYYKVVLENVEELLPIIYTPTVGEACLKFSHIYRIDKGFFITPEDKGHIRPMLDNWPEDDIRIIVVTDGNRILGLGDLGANGIGIPIGKLSLYTAMGGIHPDLCLPIMFDMGTDNKELLDDPLYLGYPHKRLQGKPYFELLDEFITGVQEKYPNALIQFEDFLTPNAYEILTRYRDKVLCFNDDIQGTASVALAGLYGATKLANIDFKDANIMFLGAGSAATGIADLLVLALMKEGLTQQESKDRLWFVDINGLLTTDRADLMSHNLPYAKNQNSLSFKEALKSVKPNILIGASGAFGTFDQEAFDIMCENNERPIIFALSNPTSKAECTAEQAYKWSKGKAIFASGSPFEPVVYEGKTYHTGQGNNVYIFPGIGLAAMCVEAKTLPEEVFMVAAEALAALITEDEMAQGRVYPRLTEMRKISYEIALSVAKYLVKNQLSKIDPNTDLEKLIKENTYDPTY
jgi:malate dehydrogenase (oxaloacetate-decarboxylating)(NADP+)